MLNVIPGFQELQSASPKPVPIARTTSASRVVSFAARVPQMPVMPSASRVIFRKGALPHERRRDRHIGKFRQLTQFIGRFG
jgi:hypothetical protein